MPKTSAVFLCALGYRLADDRFAAFRKLRRSKADMIHTI
jgi:hypothetical protein